MSETIRACFRAVKAEGATPPYDTIHLKVFYPAQRSQSQQETDLGIVPADSEHAPFPVVILFNGINCGPELYQWLAVKLAKNQLVVVTFAWVAENLPGVVGLTPGVDFRFWQPATYGTGPTASALGPILSELEALQANGLLAGLLDLQRVIVGGHSAGGRAAIESADPRFFSQLAAAFGYGVHTAAPMMLGYEAQKILPLPSALPMLLMGGTCDGVIAASAGRYGMEPSPTKAVERTFEEAIAGGRNDSYLMLIEGANHSAIAYPEDPTAARGFLDQPMNQPAEEVRALIAKTVNLFIDAHVRHKPEALQSLDQQLNTASPLIASLKRK